MGLSRVFVANRGEIAVRIIRAARSLGIETVIGVSAADTGTLGAELADRCVVLGPADAGRSYLNEGLIVQAALATGCDSVHPGYGFLSERPALARLCEDNGLAFVGPRADTIEALGDKLSARAIAESAGVPLVPGSRALEDVDAACAAAEAIGFPVVIKATAGGGGRGMFLADDSATLRRLFGRAGEEARSAFGNGSLYIERFVPRARHVEVQVFGDGQGKVIHFGERDCSVQRRYQKLIEEAPCAVLPPALRQQLLEAAVRLTSSLNYRNAGTVEFLYDMDREAFYFIEVNARIQVEHPVSELISRRDLVAMQLALAGGEPLALEQRDVVLHGHALECRINAEDPGNNFQPSPGRISSWQAPDGDFIRLDTFCRPGTVISPFYDSMIAKLIVYGNDREEAVARMQRALARLQVAGIRTNVGLQRYLVGHRDFRGNSVTTSWLERSALPDYPGEQQESEE